MACTEQVLVKRYGVFSEVEDGVPLPLAEVIDPFFCQRGR